ncbi:dynamin family protein [Dactylosporangium cerinum]
MADAEQELAELRDTVLGLAGQIEVVATDQVGPAAGAAVRDVAATVRRQEYFVVVCGEFKRGKSSLLNAIIGRPQLFPTGETLTTATLMTVRWGPQARAVAHIRTADGDEIEEEVGLDDLTRYVSTAGGSEAHRVGRVDVRLPDPASSPASSSSTPRGSAASTRCTPRSPRRSCRRPTRWSWCCRRCDRPRSASWTSPSGPWPPSRPPSSR